jgi:hypothetical protein
MAGGDDMYLNFSEPNGTRFSAALLAYLMMTLGALDGFQHRFRFHRDTPLSHAARMLGGGSCKQASGMRNSCATGAVPTSWQMGWLVNIYECKYLCIYVHMCRNGPGM